MPHVHLVEIRKLQLTVRCWFLCPKCTKTHLRASLIPKIFPGVISPDLRKRGRGEERREKERGGEGLRHGCWGMDAPENNRPQVTSKTSIFRFNHCCLILLTMTKDSAANQSIHQSIIPLGQSHMVTRMSKFKNTSIKILCFKWNIHTYIKPVFKNISKLDESILKAARWIVQEWDHTNFLVDLSGFYANCKALERPAGLIHVDRRTPDGESVVGVVGTIEGEQSDVDSTTAYIEELIKQWMTSRSYDANVRRSAFALCAALLSLSLY